MKRNLPKIIIFILLAILAISMILPLIFLFLTTFKSKPEYAMDMFSLPTEISFANYVTVLKSFDFVKMTINSIIVSGGSVTLSILVTSMAGYSLGKLDFSGKKIVTVLFLLGMFMPGQVLLLPVYNILIKLNLVDKFTGLILFNAATSIPFTVMMIMANLKGVQNEILEAARIDGAGVFKSYFHIVLPLLKPTLATVGMLNFIGYWNELLYSLIILQDPSKRTVTLSIVSLSNAYQSNTPLLYAGLLLSAGPVIIFYLIMQKQMIKGVTGGAVK